MFRLITGCFAGLVLVSIPAEKASAVVTQTPVTPASIKEAGSKFSVTAAKGKDGLIHFTITYRLPEPQYLVAHFELRDGDKILTRTDTPRFARETSATYYVAVSPNQLADARFELSQNWFSESGGQPVALPGGTIFQIDLQAFGKNAPDAAGD
jgi:hypothetical protein